MGFGDISHDTKGKSEARLTLPSRNPPQDLRLKLRLRHPNGKPIGHVMVDGKPSHAFAADTITVPGNICRSTRALAWC